MIVISNYVQSTGMNYPEDAVIRINVAWIESSEALEQIMQSLSGRKIWLDYPTGRTKPPQPKFSLDETIEFTKRYNVHYFAFSNAEDTLIIEEIRRKVPTNVVLVPKIETINGIGNLAEIMRAAKTKIVMLDKEDLYTDVKGNQVEFYRLVEQCRKKCKELDATCLELKGVVFGHD